MIIKYKDSFISDNSKEAATNSYFLQSKQNQSFVAEAKSKGAKVITVAECKKMLGIDESVKIIGVSGTNGKTTVSSAIYDILLNLGYKCLLCGTRGVFLNKEILAEKSLTTPPILALLSYLSEAKKANCDFFIMEVSSHAIAQDRIEGLNFAAKVFTNLSQDHLDFHKSLAEYKRVKESFFEDESLKIMNSDENFAYNPVNSITYGFKDSSDYKILSYDLDEGIKAKIEYKKEIFDVNSSLPGLFNLYNILAASALVKELLGLDFAKVLETVRAFKGVSGRMELVADKVIVDFAHTPDGINKVLSALKDKNLIVLFGAGGNRDKSKRPLMAKEAKKFASKLIITSDNPRDEEPQDIINDILSGIEVDETVFVEVDRKKAIQKALELKQKDDFVLILGKGDENYQEIKSQKHSFSDKEVVLEFLTKLS